MCLGAPPNKLAKGLKIFVVTKDAANIVSGKTFPVDRARYAYNNTLYTDIMTCDTRAKPPEAACYLSYYGSVCTQQFDYVCSTKDSESGEVRGQTNVKDQSS